MARSNETFDTYMTNYLGLVNEDDLNNIFERHDKDGNGFIDAKELDGFIKDLFTKKLTAEEVQEFKRIILEKVDNNNDGQLDKKEIRNFLPTDENFLLQLKNIGKKICGVDFMKIWNHYDKNKNQVLDGSELDGFLKDLILRSHPATPQDDYLKNTIESYKRSLLNKYKKDGETQGINRADLFHLLKVEVICQQFEGECSKNFDEVFSEYDKDNSGEIDGDELSKFLSALHLYSEEELPDEIKDVILTKLDKNKDNKIQKSELREYLGIKE